MLRATLIAAFLTAMSPCFAQQIRIITGDVEHVYGPDGQIVDDAQLRAKNRRAERRMQEQRARTEFDQQRAGLPDGNRGQPPTSWWSDPDLPRQPPKSAWNDPKIRRQAPKSWWSVP